MFGLGGRFLYSECDNCGSLSLTELPSMDQYYPMSYYSRTSLRPIRQELARSAFYSCAWHFPALRVGPARLAVLRKSHAPFDSRILDVGCGSGAFLLYLRRLGFTNLTGIDPYPPALPAITGISVSTDDITSVPGLYDVIFFTHSLEHMADPPSALSAAAQRLAPTGLLLLDLPVLGYAWRRYGTNWVQLDAPRHTTLFTRDGLALAAAQAGLAIVAVAYNSSTFQFWGSDVYRRGGSLARESPSVLTWPWVKRSLRYLPRTLHTWYLNRRGDGDQALFVMSH